MPNLVFLPCIAGALSKISIPPTTLGNCLLWMDGTDITKWYTDNSSFSGVHVVNDGDAAGFGVADGVSAMCVRGGGSTKPIYKKPIVGGVNGVRFGSLGGPTNSPLGLYTRSAQMQVTQLTVASLGSVYTFAGTIWAATVVALSSGNPYGGDQIFGDLNARIALNMGSIDSTHYRLWYYVYDGADKQAHQDILKSTWYVFGGKYDGTNIKLRVNGGPWSTTAAGASTPTTGVLSFDKIYAGAGVGQFDTTGVAFYNSLLADADLLDVERYFGRQCGVIF